MAKGYPDYYGFPLFPELGDYNIVDSVPIVLNPGDYTSIVNVSNKGIFHGAWAYLYNIDDMSLPEPRILIDGHTYAFKTIDNYLSSFFPESIEYFPIALVEYDVPHKKAALIFGKNITFVSNLNIRIYNSAVAGVDTFTVEGWGMYSLIV